MPSPYPQQPEKTPEQCGLRLSVANPSNWKDAFQRFDEFQQFKIRTTLDYLDKVNKELTNGTALYEKLIVLDGATIALSITWITSLSSRLASTQRGGQPHLWMVDVSWCLLLVSIFCCYHVISRSQLKALSVLLSFNSQFTDYVYQRLGVVVSQLKQLFAGEINVGTETVDISQAFSAFQPVLAQEKDNVLKGIADAISTAKEVEKPIATFAGIAIYSTMLAVAFLCIFTILTIKILL